METRPILGGESLPIHFKIDSCTDFLVQPNFIDI